MSTTTLSTKVVDGWISTHPLVEAASASAALNPGTSASATSNFSPFTVTLHLLAIGHSSVGSRAARVPLGSVMRRRSA